MLITIRLATSGIGTTTSAASPTKTIKYVQNPVSFTSLPFVSIYWIILTCCNRDWSSQDPLINGYASGLQKEARDGQASGLGRRRASSSSERRRKAYGGLRMDPAKGFKSLEQENARLKKRVAESVPGQPDPEGSLLGKLLGPAERREQRANESRGALAAAVSLD